MAGPAAEAPHVAWVGGADRVDDPALGRPPRGPLRPSGRRAVSSVVAPERPALERVALAAHWRATRLREMLSKFCKPPGAVQDAVLLPGRDTDRLRFKRGERGVQARCGQRNFTPPSELVVLTAPPRLASKRMSRRSIHPPR